MVPLEPKPRRIAAPSPPAKEPARGVSFSSFRLDYRANRLTRGGVPIPLRPKSWAVLAHLLERPGRLVRTDELLDAVWPDVSVTPDTVGKSIGELRRVLGDDIREPKFIETARGQGFRFIGDVRREEPVADRDPASVPTGAAPFVGRVPEIERLAYELSRADAAEPKIVFVTGEAGIGKTALVDEFVRSAGRRPQPPWTARGTCVEQHGSCEPYLPVLDALGSLARRRDAAALPEVLRRFAPTWLAQMPWLSPADAEELRQVLGETRPERMLREFAVLLEELTRDRTLLLQLDDLQWADTATVDLLSFLGRRRQPARCLILGTYRAAEVVAHDHPVGGVARSLVAHGLASEVPVHGFTAGEIERYLRARLPGLHAPARLAEPIHRHTDGNPLFVSATLDHMRSHGWLLETSPGWAVAAPLDLDALGVPDDARRLITDQLRALSPRERELLATAAVAGRRFLARTVAAASGVSAERAEDCFDALSHAARFVRVAAAVPGRPRFSPPCYEFVHELYRRAVYDEIPPTRRSALHRHVGDALERLHSGALAGMASELARHYELAGDAAKALHYLERAAAVALERFAPREAIRLYEDAITITEGLGSESERRTRELSLRLAMAAPLASQFGYPSDALLRNCERANELAAEIGTDEQRFESAYALLHVFTTRADADRVTGVERQLRDLADRIGDPVARMLADSARLRAAVLFGSFQKASRLMRGELASTPLAISPQGVTRFGADPILGARSHHAIGLWFRGEIAEAIRTSSACLAVARAPSTPEMTRCLELLLASLLGVLTRNAELAKPLAAEAEALARARGFELWEAIAGGLSGWARLHTGEPEHAIRQLERATRQLARLGMRLFSTSILAYRAEAHLTVGDLAAGLAAIDQGLRIAETTLERMYWPELWRLKAELLFAAEGGRTSDAPGTCARRGLEIAQRSGARSLALRTASTWVRVSRGGERDAAGARLRAIYGSFAGEESTPDLADARALLEEVFPRVDLDS